jgi:hypothetical protein
MVWFGVAGRVDLSSDELPAGARPVYFPLSWMGWHATAGGASRACRGIHGAGEPSTSVLGRRRLRHEIIEMRLLMRETSWFVAT